MRFGASDTVSVGLHITANYHQICVDVLSMNMTLHTIEQSVS